MDVLRSLDGTEYLLPASLLRMVSRGLVSALHTDERGNITVQFRGGQQNVYRLTRETELDIHSEVITVVTYNEEEASIIHAALLHFVSCVVPTDVGLSRHVKAQQMAEDFGRALFAKD